MQARLDAMEKRMNSVTELEAQVEELEKNCLQLKQMALAGNLSGSPRKSGMSPDGDHAKDINSMTKR